MDELAGKFLKYYEEGGKQLEKKGEGSYKISADRETEMEANKKMPLYVFVNAAANFVLYYFLLWPNVWGFNCI